MVITREVLRELKLGEEPTPNPSEEGNWHYGNCLAESKSGKSTLRKRNLLLPSLSRRLHLPGSPFHRTTSAFRAISTSVATSGRSFSQ
jgi:hypothetical protein